MGKAIKSEWMEITNVMAENMRKYHQAAISYVGIGVIIVILTMVFIPDMHYRSGTLPLFGGIAILLVLAYFVYRGIRWLTIILCVLALARSSWWIYSFISFSDEQTRWVYAVNALLNIVLAYMLARAAADKTQSAAHS